MIVSMDRMDIEKQIIHHHPSRQELQLLASLTDKIRAMKRRDQNQGHNCSCSKKQRKHNAATSQFLSVSLAYYGVSGNKKIQNDCHSGYFLMNDSGKSSRPHTLPTTQTSLHLRDVSQSVA